MNLYIVTSICVIVHKEKGYLIKTNIKMKIIINIGVKVIKIGVQFNNIIFDVNLAAFLSVFIGDYDDFSCRCLAFCFVVLPVFSCSF
jgi:hypothetical protein